MVKGDSRGILLLLLFTGDELISKTKLFLSNITEEQADENFKASVLKFMLQEKERSDA